MAESVALWSVIRSRVAEQRNLGCMLAGLESLCVERWAAAGREDAEGTLACRGRTQPGCKASAGEGKQDRLLPDMLVAALGHKVVHGRVMFAWAGVHNPAALVRDGRVDTGLPGRSEAAQVLQLAAGGTAEERW